MMFRIGFGVDVHQLKSNLPLWLGGIEIPSDKGALGHSDADVLLHAICDAILGAANLRDIGFHFSDKDPQFKGIDSKILLAKVYELMVRNSFQFVNLDATVILEEPKLNPHVPSMQETIANLLHCDIDRISIKATTHEKMDSFGEGKAIKAYATVLLEKQK